MTKAWDKIFFLVSLSVLIGFAIYLGLSIPDELTQIKASSAYHGKRGGGLETLQADTLQLKLDSWLHPQPWDVSAEDHQLFVSRKYLYVPAENAIKLYDKDAIIDGLPLGWLEKNNLPISDVFIASRDTDGDGFSNLSEYKANTDPNDPQSHPPYLSILRLKERVAKPFYVTFQSKIEIDSQIQFQLSTPQGSKYMHTGLKVNDEFDGFKIVSYEAKTQPPAPPRYETDVSELHLLNEKSQESFTLVMHEEQNIPEVSVTFVLLVPSAMSSAVTAKVGEEFTMTLNQSKGPVVLKFKLLKSTETATTILDESTGIKQDIPLYNDKEAAQIVPK